MLVQHCNDLRASVDGSVDMVVSNRACVRCSSSDRKKKLKKKKTLGLGNVTQNQYTLDVLTIT